jgi:hypothetical protein
MKLVKKQKIVIIIILLFIIVLFYYHFSNKKENFDGSSTNNVFSKLSCITGTDGNEYVFKVDNSLNKKDSKTLHSLVKSIKVGSPINQVTKSEFVESGDTVPCDEANFSTYYVKKLRDPVSKTRTLFNSFNPSWRNQECTVSDIKDTNHWCNKVYNAINDNPKLCDTSDPKNNPPKYCNDFKDVKTFASSSDETKGPLINNLKASGRSCPDQCTVKSGRIPNSYTDPITGNLVCLTDSGLVDGACIGTNLFTITNGKIIDSYSKGCKRCASRASTVQDKKALADIPDNVWPFNKCLEGCAI